jgi:hypothetical protein
MPCPSCGGTVRLTLAPGFFECRSARVWETPSPIHPALGHTTNQATCGMRYQEGQQATTVECVLCGLFAVGRCRTCSDPVCGVHAQAGPAGVECSTCHGRRRDQAATTARLEAAAEAEATQRREDELPIREYLRSLGFEAECRRPATGADVAWKLIMRGTRGVSRDGCWVIRMNGPFMTRAGALVDCTEISTVFRKPHQRHTERLPPTHLYTGAEVTAMLKHARESQRNADSMGS